MKLTGEDIYRQYDWRYKQEDFRFCPRCGHELSLEALHIPDEKQLVCHGCHFILYLDPKLVVTGVVAHGGDVLLLRRAENPGVGLWGLPGGHVQRGEDPRVALCNEVRQEAGVEIEVDRLTEIYTLKDFGVVQLAFQCEAKNRFISKNIESYEARFFSENEVPWNELAFETTRLALNAAGYRTE